MKWFKYLITIIIIVLVGINFDKITTIISEILESNPKIIISDPNSYYKDVNYSFVKLSKDYIPYSKQDIKDIFYSILNSGYDTFTFYCPSEYTSCLRDIAELSNDKNTLTNINNFVSPFNSFNNVKVIYSTTGEVNIEITKLYNEDEINSVKKRMEEIENEVYSEEMSDEDKILVIHDYIINHTKYDELRKDGNSPYKSNIAYGSLIEGYAVCGGYADAMALFLDSLGIPNFKISSDSHVWNAIYINNKWLHLDLTWDDPVTLNSDVQTLTHKFYLIDTKTLEDYHISDHEFDKTIYTEVLEQKLIVKQLALFTSR